MVHVERPQAAMAFLRLLDDAAKLIGDCWFLLPYAPSTEDEDTAVYRERVYCYELYHQLRVLSNTPAGTDAGAPDYVLSGEIDKAGLNAMIPGGRQKPDLVWHVPGRSTFNAVVVEVKKSVGLDNHDLCKDLTTLNAFLHVAGREYECGVLLVFGPANRHGLRRRVLRAADAIGIADATRRKTHLLWHSAAGHSLNDLGTLEA